MEAGRVLAATRPTRCSTAIEAERIGFARRLVATTDRAFTLATAEGPIANLLRTRITPWLFPRIIALESAREFMFRTVSQVGLNYRGGPLSSGRARQVHGGDRLPWVVADGIDNFASLATIAWQIHVYGTPSPALCGWCKDHNIVLNAFGWRAEHQAAGLTRDATYLIRPDTYVAEVDTSGTPEAVERYFIEREQFHLG